MTMRTFDGGVYAARIRYTMPRRSAVPDPGGGARVIGFSVGESWAVRIRAEI